MDRFRVSQRIELIGRLIGEGFSFSKAAIVVDEFQLHSKDPRNLLSRDTRSALKSIGVEPF